jgi:serine/threonine protein kinase/predicted Zn-dependent protease
MTTTEKCPKCGCPLPKDAPGKQCPACPFETALSSRSTSSNEVESGTALAAPPPEVPVAKFGPPAVESTRITIDFGLSDHEIVSSWAEVGSAPARSVDAVQERPSNGGNGTTPAAPPGPTESRSVHRETLLSSPDDEALEPWSEISDAPVIPGYAIAKLLGRGGMGVVYKAVQQQLKRTVALKMIRGDLGVSDEQLERFRLEAEAVARLRHPNVVQIYEVGSVGVMPYFSLEMLEGGTLAERLAEGPMKVRQAAELSLRLARGVDAVHRVGIIHRDLKPANVLFDTDDTPKISDFGLAKRLEVEEGPTVSGQIMGTPSYMAPEQAQGLTHQIGPATDIYALGSILYEMLTGRPPFKGPTMMETLFQVVYEDVVSPSRFQSKVPRDLETICLKCLAKEPSRRYATAAALADDLGRFLAGETILARPTPAWERAAKWARRRPARAAMLSFGVAAAIGLFVAAEQYNAYKQSENERKAAEKQSENERIARIGLEGVSALDKGLQQRADGQLEEARVTLSKLLSKLPPEERLADLRKRIDEALRDVEERRRLAAVRAADRERFAHFGRLRDQALFLDGNAPLFPVMLSGAGKAETSPAAPAGVAPAVVQQRDVPWKQVRDTARAALEVFPLGIAGPDAVAAPLPASLAPTEQAEVEADRYLMLMVLSEAVARPLPGEDPRQQATTALGLLDRAAQLRRPTPAYHLRRAACLERRGAAGDEVAARLERERAAQLPPADAFDHLLLGRECFVRKDWHEARTHFDESLRLKPDSFWARCWLASAGLNSVPPRAEAAKTALTACLDQQPSYAWLYLLRGSACGQLGVAQANAARTLANGREFTAEAETSFANAENDFRSALERGLDAGFHYMLLMNRGVMRFRRNQWEAAADDFTQAIALEPGRYNGSASLAQVFRMLGRPAEAVEQMSKAIALEPKLAALYRGRAQSRLDRGDLASDKVEAEAALQDLEDSARLEPSGSRAAAEDHSRRGQLLLRLGRPRDALAAAGAALAIAPNSAMAHVVRVAALLETERYDELHESCDVAVAEGAATAELYRLRGLARAARTDYAGAIDDYTHALTLHHDEPAEVYRNRGWAHLYASSFELAQRDFDAVLRLAASDFDGHAGRAAARVRLGLVREAVADAEASLRLKEPSPRLLYIAAQTYAQASSRAATEAARRGRAVSSDTLSYEARAAELLRQALDRTPAEGRSAFWRDFVARDILMRPLFHNPRILHWLKSRDSSRL